MENRSSYTIVGVFVVLAMLFISAFVWWITTKTNPNVKYESYFIHTKELPNGLKEGSQVKYIGVPAGVIKDIRFVKDSKYSTIEIELAIQSDFPIKKDSMAKVEIQGLSGISNLNLTKGEGDDFAKGEKPILELDRGFLGKLNMQAEGMAENITKTLNKINDVLSEQNLANFASTLESISSITKKLDENASFGKINSILASVDNILKEFDQNRTNLVMNLNSLIKNSDKFMTSSTTTSTTLNKTLKLINSDMQDGNYNLKETISPTLHEASVTLIELKKLLREFQTTLFRLEDNPYDFFFRDTTQKDKR